MSKDKEKEVKPPKRGIGTVAKEAIRAGLTNTEALAAVLVEFPNAKASMSSINWYRNKLRQTEKDIPTSRELKKAAKPEETPETPETEETEEVTEEVTEEEEEEGDF